MLPWLPKLSSQCYLDTSRNWGAIKKYSLYDKICVTKLKVAACNHPTDSPLYMWLDVWFGDLQALKKHGLMVHSTKYPYWDQVSLNNTKLNLNSFTWNKVEAPDGSVVKTRVSGAWSVLFMIWRSWVQTPDMSNLECVMLLSKSYLKQKYCRLKAILSSARTAQSP